VEFQAFLNRLLLGLGVSHLVDNRVPQMPLSLA